ncbi:MAG: UDP-N-acetylmuramoyl-tripeptide--D-alanyl-D-alanine ligase [Phycisphaerales bacterium]|nr:UDP-N-acetylmuramoyl-tripeptide--D-alanyl-D-alanine ligase [Planctomycetota bacterium]
MKEAMSFWSFEHWKSMLGGTWVVRPGAGAPVPGGASIDTRSLQRGNVFFALKGEKTDGHKFLAAAARAGSPLAIVEEEKSLDSRPEGMAILRVERVGGALLRAAGDYRKTLEGTRVISVGGSNGKTTTTRLIEAVLSGSFRGTASQKSFNNAIGVPLTILSARRGDHFLLCEVGTNARGEIAELAGVVAPDIAVITSIGREHLEGLASLEGVITEEASIAAGIQPGGVAILPASPEELFEQVQGLMRSVSRTGEPNIIRFGTSEAADLRISGVTPDEQGTGFSINRKSRFRVGLIGSHNACNGAAAVAVGRRFGLDDAAIAAGLLRASAPEMRMRLESCGQIQVLNDAYNANPDSMLAGIRAFAELADARKPARRVVVLGDMLEMGSAGPDAHREIGEAIAAESKADLTVLVGPLMMFAAERLRKAWPNNRVFPIASVAGAGADEVAALLKPGDFVMLKGSRGMGLERVLKSLKAAAVGREAGAAV